MKMILRKIKDTILFIETIFNLILLTANGVKYGSGIKIKGCPYIRRRGEFIIKNNVRINSRITANPIGGDRRCYFVIGPNARLIIHDGAAISNSAINCYNSIIIEENVMIGGSCKIYDTDFHPLNKDARKEDVTEMIATKPVLIKANAFIGGHSIILKGVTIGENSIIGAGSIVTRNVPDNEIWAGNPASFIRKINV
jgi:acetyltransferase-like isoleucine patch superfamily enzyme